MYRIKDHKLQIVSIFGFIKSVIYFGEILSWNEVEKENQHMKWKDLTLHLRDRNIKISSASLKNYHQFRKVLVNDKKRNETAELAWLKRNALQFAIGFMIFGSLIYYWSFNVYQNKNKTYQTNDIQILTSTITNEVKIHKGSKSSRSIRLKLSDYPDFNFVLGGVAYSASDKQKFVSDFKEGDLVTIHIAKEAFHKKLVKDWELGFWDKSINYRLISIIGITGEQKDYLTLEEFNKAKSSESKWAFWFLLGFATFMFGSGIYMLIERRKFKLKDANRH